MVGAQLRLHRVFPPSCIQVRQISWYPVLKSNLQEISWRIFVYSFLGLNIPTVRSSSDCLMASDHLQITLQCLGAAAAIAVPSVPNWDAGYTDGNVGGLINAMLSPVGKFGKFLMVLLSLSVTATTAPTIYSICIDFQIIIPPLVVIPRYVFSVFVTVL
jgi:hypothetical protein